MRRGPSFFPLKTTDFLFFIFFGTKMGIFYRGKAFHVGKKIRKNDFAPSEKYSSYTPGHTLSEVCV